MSTDDGVEDLVVVDVAAHVDDRRARASRAEGVDDPPVAGVGRCRRRRVRTHQPDVSRVGDRVGVLDRGVREHDRFVDRLREDQIRVDDVDGRVGAVGDDRTHRTASPGGLGIGKPGVAVTSAVLRMGSVVVAVSVAVQRNSCEASGRQRDRCGCTERGHRRAVTRAQCVDDRDVGSAACCRCSSRDTSRSPGSRSRGSPASHWPTSSGRSPVRTP